MWLRARWFALVASTLLASAVSARGETLEIPGLSAPATVYTDALGVPHIVAETLEDAARAQGYVHARDRFFQMDVSRHRAEGTLAELTGKAFDILGSDSFLRGSAVNLAAAFPGRCKATGATTDATALAACARERVLCRGCRSVGAMDALALPCDGLDDGAVDDSCG